MMLKCLEKAQQKQQMSHALCEAFRVLETELKRLNQGQVPLESLVLTVRLSRNPNEYKVRSAAVCAAEQIMTQTRKKIGAGQKVSYLYTKEGVAAWEKPLNGSTIQIDKAKYRELLANAAGTIFTSFGISQKQLSDFVHGYLQLELGW